MIRVLCMICGLTGAAALSQYPEFSQQYLQRLAGQVDELTRQAEGFDQTALTDGMGREQMLQAMAQTPLVAGQEAMWRTTFARHARLTENLALLRAAGPVERLTLPHRMADPDTVKSVWADFTPAVPLSVAGVTAAGAGFLGGWALLLGLYGLLTMPLRKSAPKVKPPQRRNSPVAKGEPPLMRPTLIASNPENRPRLAGVRR